MALLKPIQLLTGYEAEYIRISEVHMSNGTNDCAVKVQVWKDQNTRNDSTKRPLEECVLQITMSGEGETLTKCYNGLKDLTEFTGAQDI